MVSVVKASEQNACMRVCVYACMRVCVYCVCAYNVCAHIMRAYWLFFTSNRIGGRALTEAGYWHQRKPGTGTNGSRVLAPTEAGYWHQWRPGTGTNGSQVLAPTEAGYWRFQNNCSTERPFHNRTMSHVCTECAFF